MVFDVSDSDWQASDVMAIALSKVLDMPLGMWVLRVWDENINAYRHIPKHPVVLLRTRSWADVNGIHTGAPIGLDLVYPSEDLLLVYASMNDIRYKFGRSDFRHHFLNFGLPEIRTHQIVRATEYVRTLPWVRQYQGAQERGAAKDSAPDDFGRPKG